MKNSSHVIHPIPPLYDENSHILILGSFPSVKSRESEFFYGHPRNRFWHVIATVFGANVPNSIEEKKKMLLENGVALWDVIHSCEIVGSSDSSIKNVIVNDIGRIVKDAKIERIYLNGNTAKKYYDRYIRLNPDIETVCLPSTSPANAALSFERLVLAWSVIK